jgi:hypothetical protein
MYVLNNEKYESELALDDIVFKLCCQGKTNVAKIFVRNYLKNFGGQVED